MMSPCKGCADRHTACHGSFEKYKEWYDKYKAQQKHLEENRHRFDRPWSHSREVKIRSFIKNGPGTVKGGDQ